MKRLLSQMERPGQPRRTVAVHLAFWVGVLGFYTVYFGRQNGDYGQSLLFVSLLLPVAVVTTYFLVYVLVPRYLLRRRYARFALYVSYAVVVSVYLELVVVVVSFVFVAQYRIQAMNPATLDVLGLIVGLYVVVFLALAADLLQRWYRLQADHARAEQARLEAELALRDAELKLLRAQLHPHFLFNTLNNLYGLTLERSERAPDVVLRIADLLDYVLYRCDAPRVPLAGEVAHLENYLALERLRYDERVKVTLETQGPTEGYSIAPLLLMPFVENSFKHGVSRSTAAGWVRIHLTVGGGHLTFTVANSKLAGVNGPAGEGIGLENIRRRLGLLYPESHTLRVEEAPGCYRVDLQVDLEATGANDGRPDEDACEANESTGRL